ncbi:MAG: anthranilate synthase component II [Bacteroidales bacterium]
MKLLLIDNYDSFVYNLYHALRSITDAEIVIKKNDAVSPDEAASFDKIVLSPGPGIPTEAGELLNIIRYCSGKRPILGVCLGHQAIAEAFGGSLINLTEPYHGIESVICTDKNTPLFSEVGDTMTVGRYHSWVVDERTLPEDLVVTARCAEGSIMAIAHRYYPVYGVQFHPESILTPQGNQILKSWIELT